MHHYSKLSALDLSLAVQQGEVTVVELSQYFIESDLREAVSLESVSF